MCSVSLRAGSGGAGARRSFPWGVSLSGPGKAAPEPGPPRLGGRTRQGDLWWGARTPARPHPPPPSCRDPPCPRVQRGRTARGHISPHQRSPLTPAGLWGEPGSPLGVSAPSQVGPQRPLVTPKRSPSLPPCHFHVLWIRPQKAQQRVN